MKSEKETPKHEGHFIRTLNYLKEHYTDDARLDRIAEEAGLSPWHWHRIYRSLMCETMHETVKRRRLYRAARLIAYSDKPFADIARECGYNNAQSFARSFRKAYGMLPQQYRDHRVSYSHPVSIEDRAAVPVAMLAHPGDCQQIGDSFDHLAALLCLRGAPLLQRAFSIHEVQNPEDGEKYVATSITGASPSEPLALADIRANYLCESLTAGEIAAGRYAVLHYRGTYVDLDRVFVWFMEEWFPGQGLQIASDRAIVIEYLFNLDCAQRRAEICLPLVE